VGTQLVWFKRDLRLEDHRPLAEACKAGPVICLYVYEPEVFEAEETDASHVQFISECLASLDAELQERGGQLVYRRGTLPEIFDELHAEHPFEAIWAHEETGSYATYQRDRRVRRWAKDRDIPMHEFHQNGVVRRLKDRDGWSKNWNIRMTRPLFPAPERIDSPPIKKSRRRSEKELGFEPTRKTGLQRGGIAEGRDVLDTFLFQRGARYRFDMSSPVTAWEGCSRLSPHLALGTLSMKQVYQATRERRAELKERKKSGEDLGGPWLQSMSSFSSRLRWHCHFMQKLEDEPELEFRNLHRAADGLREDDWNEERFQAWCAGQTGYPMVDACIRALHEHSWINFRMRAMLMSFSSYHLWLHWRRPAVFLGRHFLDFEAGIHYSQSQMQSGTTGINTVRIYSPIKQVQDQDRDGKFIRRYVPELEGIPDEYLPEPHTMPSDIQHASGCLIGKHYPEPIVDHASAYKEARGKMASLRSSKHARAESKRIYDKHGSRKRPRPRAKA